MSKVPSNRPQLKAADVERILEAKGVNRKKNPVCVLAVRGYYLDTMGQKGKNDRGIFDDAAFVVSPTAFVAVNWNTDPSAYRKGSGRGSAKGMASLKPGVWSYQIGKHKGKGPAGVQADEVTVIRDGDISDYPDTGWFGINLHWGSASGGTSSLGCQTAPVNQWTAFINPLVAELKRYTQKIFPYVLITVEEMKAILNVEVPRVDEPKSAPAPTPGDLGPAIDLIKKFEGLYLNAYLDPVGIPTIGWGTIAYPDGRKVQMGEHCTAEQAEAWLHDEVAEKAKGVRELVKVPITNNQFCALVSFAYNLGIGALKGSTLLKRLNAGEKASAVANEFGKWINAGGKPLKGLIRRRGDEAKLFLS